MILNLNINADYSINSLMDLNKLQDIEKHGKLKVNASEIGREMGVDRRTVRKYINGYVPSKTRKKPSKMDRYYSLIKDLLADDHKIFRYRSVLYRYLVDNYKLEVPESTFRHYIDKHKEFSTYFTKVKQQKTKPIVRYETAKAEQMQIDWKESLKFTLKNGELIEFNILVSLMSYSRFRIYRLSLSKTRDVLLSLLTDTFEALGGVPERVLVDNMSTVMDEPRTKYKRGKVNNQFQQFADDFGFKVQPCIAGRPETKAKVESPMRILDELMAYNGELDYEGLVRKLKEINDRENHRFHTSYQGIPILLFNKEKDSLHPLPTKDIRSQYKIKHRLVKVNKSSMISVASHQYSVPSKYIDKRLSIQIYDNQIHVYHSTDLVVIHPLSNNPLNYKEEHYIEALHQTLSYKEDNAIEKRAKENLKKIGARYDTNRL